MFGGLSLATRKKWEDRRRGRIQRGHTVPLSKRRGCKKERPGKNERGERKREGESKKIEREIWKES